MNLYNAFMQAADQVEKHPETFNFITGTIPNECGTPGCALGWVGHFAGMRGEYMDVAVDLLKLGTWSDADFVFYKRMDELEPLKPGVLGWRDRAEWCAETLRLYAEKYHGSERVPS